MATDQVPGTAGPGIDADTVATTVLVADPEHPVGRDAPDLFLTACEDDASAHGGAVSVNRVRQLLRERDAQIAPNRLAAFWSNFTGPKAPMRRATTADGIDLWDFCDTGTIRNAGKPQPVRIWTGRATS